MTTIDETEARLNTHEAVCAERYEGINARLKRIEGWFVSGVGVIITLLLALLVRVKI